MWPVCFSRITRVCRVSVRSGSAKPPTCGFAESSDCWTASTDLSGAAAKIAFATAPLTLAAAMPEPESAVSKLTGTVSPAFGDRGP